ncbi:MAG: hypothetical protein EOO88_31210 [Pedobacter sp.]|nr:MAG: hypothetical protein EOO88_31210 [Pedobacter sp.]
MQVEHNVYDPALFKSAIAEIHSYLMAQIEVELSKTDTDFSADLTAFLAGLCKSDNTDTNRLYQSHRLAINIAIDLASKTQSAAAYVRLFRNLAFTDMKLDTQDLHQLFAQASAHTDAKPAWYSKEGSLAYKLEPARQYVRVVSLTSYLKHYSRSSVPAITFDGAIQSQKSDSRSLGNLLKKEHVDTDKPIPFSIIKSQFQEFVLSGGPPQRLLWVLPKDEFEKATACSGEECSACDAIVITTGRPVTTNDIKPLSKNYQVCVTLPARLGQPSYQPTAINADWMGGGYPYLSFKRLDGFGRTFNLWTGRHDGNKHVPRFEASERVMAPFDPTTETGPFFASSLSCPTQISEANYNEVIQAAIRRFREAIC